MYGIDDREDPGTENRELDDGTIAIVYARLTADEDTQEDGFFNRLPTAGDA